MRNDNILVRFNRALYGTIQSADTSKMYDPDNSISKALIARLASATSINIKDLFHPFVLPGSIHCSDTSGVIAFEKGLLRQMYQNSGLSLDEQRDDRDL